MAERSLHKETLIEVHHLNEYLMTTIIVKFWTGGIITAMAKPHSAKHSSTTGARNIETG